MAVTDQQVLNEVQYHLLETPNNGASWSALWTAQEVLDYLNQRQYQFLKDTALTMKRTSVSTIPEETRHSLPNDWVTTQRVAWQSSDSPAIYSEIPRSDGFEADHGILDWSYNLAMGAPRLYTDGEVPTLEFMTMPATSSAGLLWVLYIALSSTFTGAGVAFSVPDEFTPSIKWGVIADMLNKAGRAHDPARAQMAEAMYQEGVEAAKTILGGWS